MVAVIIGYVPGMGVSRVGKVGVILKIGFFFVCLVVMVSLQSISTFDALKTDDPSFSPAPASHTVDPGSDIDDTPDELEVLTVTDVEGDISEPDIDISSILAGSLELPVAGATGWAAIDMPLYSEASIDSSIRSHFEAGQVFVIIDEFDEWWYVKKSDGESGWVEHRACFINLPDVIPSIVYNVTNAYSALTHSSGYEIPGVTGEILYEAWSFNHRLSRYEFIVPTLYSTSKLLSTAQQLALEAGDTIILHEAYRAHESQQRSVALLRELMEENDEVRSAIEDGPWNLNWFIATSMSNHQRGVAFDVNLGKVLSSETEQIGDFSVKRITEHDVYIMPTQVHELSPLAAIFERPVSSRSRDAWRDVPFTDTMTPGAILLQGYFDSAGFTPLASEWWHFNDLDGVIIASELGINGSFFIEGILSVVP